MERKAAVDALNKMGLKKYEAEMLMGLHKLGVSTARDIGEDTEVPRSQVYATAESLSRQGLIEIEHSEPQQYRAVRLEEARTILRRRYENQEKTAFDFLSKVKKDINRNSENIRTLRSAETIISRCTHRLNQATRNIFYLDNTGSYDSRLVSNITGSANNGINVSIIDCTGTELFKSEENITVYTPDKLQGVAHSVITRLLLIDNDWFLISLTEGHHDDDSEEYAIVSSNSEQVSVIRYMLSFPSMVK